MAVPAMSHSAPSDRETVTSRQGSGTLSEYAPRYPQQSISMPRRLSPSLGGPDAQISAFTASNCLDVSTDALSPRYGPARRRFDHRRIERGAVKDQHRAPNYRISADDRLSMGHFRPLPAGPTSLPGGVDGGAVGEHFRQRLDRDFDQACEARTRAPRAGRSSNPATPARSGHQDRTVS